MTFFLLLTFEAFNQGKGYRINIEISPGTERRSWITDLNKSRYEDTLAVSRVLQELCERYFKEGYLAAGFDSVKQRDSVFTAFFHSGESYQWGKVNLPEKLPPDQLAIPRSVKIKAGKPVTVTESNKLRERIVHVYENNGYPFASVAYDSLSFRDSIIEAKISVEPGPLILIDSIVNRSDNVVSTRVLGQIIGMKTGQVYSERKIARAGRLLQNSEIIQMSRPLEVGFTENKAWIYLSPKKKAANSFDGLVGLVPGASNGAGISLTGSVDLKLVNLLRQAETLNLRWKAPGNQNQLLQTQFEIPYFIGWPIGLTSSFDLYRKDSSYLNTDWSIGLQVALDLQNRLGFYLRQKGSNVLLKTTNPSLSDLRVNLYGIRWNWIKLENPLNPSKGFQISSNLGVGNKSIGKSSEDDTSSVYWESAGKADFFFPLSKFIVLHLGANGGYMKGEQTYDNEKFRVGGIYSLRGFEEESILADAFAIGTLELRYLFSRNSNVHLFMDTGSFWHPASELEIKGNPLGFGIGISLETGAGIILLDYAMGVSENIPLNIRNGKIHLGIKSLF